MKRRKDPVILGKNVNVLFHGHKCISIPYYPKSKTEKGTIWNFKFAKGEH